MNIVFKITCFSLAILILTTLLGEYVISREVNGYLQLAAVGVWSYVCWRLFKQIYKLI